MTLQAAIEGNQDAILAMQRAKKAVSDAEACLATFKKNPTNLAERDAFVQAATAITPAITGLALYSKAAVSAACAELAAATHEWKHKVSARRANGSTAEFEEATTCAEAAEAALAAAHRLQERVMETMSNEDATDAVAADTTIDDELLAAVPVAVEAVAAALSAFDRRDGKVVHEAAERLEAAEASLAALSERSSVTMGSQSPKQRPSSASGTMDSTMEGMKGAGTAVAALRSAQGSRPSMSVEDAIPDNVEEFLDGVATFVSAVETAGTALNAYERMALDAAKRTATRAIATANTADATNKSVGAPPSEATDEIAKAIAAAASAMVGLEKVEAVLTRSHADAESAGVAAPGGGGNVESSKMLCEAIAAATAASQQALNARTLLNKRDSHEAAALKAAKAELMRLRMLLESLRKRNRQAGIPDDRASADIEAASLAVVTAETLHRLIANTPAVAGMGRQFVKEVPTATAAVEAAVASLESRDRDAEAEALAEQLRKREAGCTQVTNLRGVLASMQERFQEVEKVLDEDGMLAALAGLDEDVDNTEDGPAAPILPPELITRGNDLLNRAETELQRRPSQSSAAGSESRVGSTTESIADLASPRSLKVALSEITQCDRMVGQIRRKVAVLEQAARRAQNAEVAAAVAHAAGVLAVARSKLEVLSARNHKHGAPPDDASMQLEKAVAAVAYARSFEKSMEGNQDQQAGSERAAKFLASAQAAVADVQAARQVRGGSDCVLFVLVLTSPSFACVRAAGNRRPTNQGRVEDPTACVGAGGTLCLTRGRGFHAVSGWLVSVFPWRAGRCACSEARQVPPRGSGIGAQGVGGWAQRA